MFTSTNGSPRHFSPSGSCDSIEAASLRNSSGGASHFVRPITRRTSEGVIRTVDLEELLVGFKGYLGEVTAAHSGQSAPYPLLNERVYTWTANDDDVRGLLHYILEAADHVRPLDNGAALFPSPDLKSSDQRPQVFKTTQPVALGPATTISVPEASFASDGQTHRRIRKSTTATIFSPDNITEITWQSSLGWLEAAGDPRHSPLGSHVSHFSQGMSSDETGRESHHQPSPTRNRSGAGPSIKPDLFRREHPGIQLRSSMFVTTSADETAQHATQGTEEAGGKLSVLNRLRKRSVQFGQTIGSFMNGDYRNADHKPRRESTVFRLRSALARIEPSRPRQDASVFGALTGAQPIDAVDRDNARRPGPPSNRCSEDGWVHRCVQHEVAGTPPG